MKENQAFERSVQDRYLDEHGHEMPDPTPMAPPVGFKRQPTIAEQMRQMIKQASYEAKMAGAETEDEANDFDVGEDMEPESPYEHDFDIDPVYEHMLARQSAPPEPAGEPASGGKPQSPAAGGSPPSPAPQDGTTAPVK